MRHLGHAWCVPEDVPYRRRDLLRQVFAVGFLFVGAVLLLAGAGDLLGREPGSAFRTVVGLGVIGLCLRHAVGVVKRLRSLDPAVAFHPDSMVLHVHPGRPLALRADEIVGVGTLTPARGRVDAQRMMHGATWFEIKTSHSGLRAKRVLVGASVTPVDLDKVRADVRRWWSNATG